ncbi:MAG: cysteine synthase family protein [Synergistaceae bacterium]|jgi:cysteine synthase A|nr:cysteine synthase family protein [Synergistaceae bacterium]
MAVMKSVLEAIGNTPLVDLERLARHWKLEGHILAKLDHLNPSGSKKDRIALGMIRAAERKGLLKPGQTVIEETSGNTGNGLALVCSVLGYPFIAVMSKGNSVERVRVSRAFGAKVVLVDQAPGAKPGTVSSADMDRVMAETERLTKELGAFCVGQFHNADNAIAQETTGDEMWEQSGGKINAIADFIGTGGGFAGIASAMRRHSPDVRCYVVEPENVPYYNGKTAKEGAGHRIQGGGYGREVPFLDRALVTGCVGVTDDEAMEGARLLSSIEGIFCGFSAGAHAVAARKLLQGAEKGKTVAIVICDSGLKYLSTDLYP